CWLEITRRLSPLRSSGISSRIPSCRSSCSRRDVCCNPGRTSRSRTPVRCTSSVLTPGGQSPSSPTAAANKPDFFPPAPVLPQLLPRGKWLISLALLGPPSVTAQSGKPAGGTGASYVHLGVCGRDACAMPKKNSYFFLCCLAVLAFVLSGCSVFNSKQNNSGSGGNPTPTPPAATLSNSINHIVVLAQENRSFDHYFGALRDYWAKNGYPDQSFDGLPQFNPASGINPLNGPAPTNPGCDPT